MYKARSFNDVSGPSIFTHWLETAPNPPRNLPSGHLRRRQNKYLQLSSTLFGDEGVRDHIREKRDFENQERLRRQILEYDIEKRKLKLEDERVYNAMGVGGPKIDIDHSKSVENYGSRNFNEQNQQNTKTNQEFNQGLPPQQQYINYDQQLHQYHQQAVNYGHQGLPPNLTYRPLEAELHSINYGPSIAVSQGQQPPFANYEPPVVIPQGHQPQIFNYGPPVAQLQGHQSHHSNYGHSLSPTQGHQHFRSAPPSGYRPKSQVPEQNNSQRTSQKQRGVSKSAYEPSFHNNTNQSRPNYQQYKGSQLQRRHSADYALTETRRKPVNPDFQLFADTPPRRKNTALIINMWQRHSFDDYSQQTAREAEEERAAILQQQIEERRYLEEERKARDFYQERFIEENAIKHRQKLLAEYEQEQREKLLKEQLLGQRREAQIAKLEAFAKQAEEEKRNKFSIVQQNKAKKAAGKISPIPVVRIESAHDATPVGAKRNKDTKASTPKKGSKHVGKGEVKPTKKKVSGQEEDRIKPKKSAHDSKAVNSKFVPKSLPEMFRDSKDDSRRNVNKGRRHEIDSMRFDHASPDHIVSFEKDGKRRRMPSKKVDDLGRTLQWNSKMPLIKPETSNYFIESDDRRRKVRSFRDKKFKKQEAIKLGPQTPPLPPIGNQKRLPLSSPTASMEEMSTQTKEDEDRNHRRPSSLPSNFERPPSRDSQPYDQYDDPPLLGENERLPDISPPTPPPVADPPKFHRPKIATPPPFDWGVELKGADDDEVAKVKIEAKKDTDEFAKKNEGIFSQLKALKRRLKISGKDMVEDDDDEDNQRKNSLSRENQKKDSNKNSPEKHPDKEKHKSSRNADVKIDSPVKPKEIDKHEKGKHNQIGNSEDDFENEPEEETSGKHKNQQAKKSTSGDLNEQTLSPEDFKRKISLNTGTNIDLKATNKTVLRSFLQKFSKRNKDYDDDDD